MPADAHTLRRAAAYLDKLGHAVEGQEGDFKTFNACKVGVRFGLSEDEFLPLLERWNERCQPPWDSRKLAAKLRSTYRNTITPRGVAFERDKDRPRCIQVKVPDPPRYPPEREVMWLWTTAEVGAVHCHGMVGRMPETPAVRWLQRMKIDVTRLGLHPEIQCRSTPPPARAREYWPTWARTGARWCDSGYGALIPLFDARGDLRSVKARWTDDDAVNEETGEVGAPDGIKSAGPFGFDLRGLVMANIQAIYLLKTGTWQEDTPRDQRELWVGEGEPDFQIGTYRLHTSRRPLRAMMGIHQGAWTAEIAARVPRDSVVVTATDPDQAGDKLAAVIQRTLQGRVRDLKRFDARRLR
jgi:hypothetical protein